MIRRFVQATNGRQALKHFSVASSGTAHKSTPNRKPVIEELINKVENQLKVPKTANSDLLISSFKALHVNGVTLPTKYLTETAKILASRNDPVRTELLIQISKTNTLLSPWKQVTGSRSQPANDPHNRFISFCVNELIRRGNTDASMKLWVRMTSSGHVANKSGMEELLDKISSTNTGPSLEFVEKIHSMMKSNLWHQSPIYFSKILRAYQQVIEISCTTNAHLVHACKSLDNLWDDCKHTFGESTLSPVYTDLLSLRTQCWTKALHTYRKINIYEIENITNTKEFAYFASRSNNSFDELLNTLKIVDSKHIASPITQSKHAATERTVIDIITDDMITILSRERTLMNSLVEGKDEENTSRPESATTTISSSSSDSAAAERIRLISRDEILEYLNKNPITTISDGGNRWSEFKRVEITERTAISRLFVELSRSGMIDEMVMYLDTYLSHYASNNSAKKKQTSGNSSSNSNNNDNSSNDNINFASSSLLTPPKIKYDMSSEQQHRHNNSNSNNSKITDDYFIGMISQTRKSSVESAINIANLLATKVNKTVGDVKVISKYDTQKVTNNHVSSVIASHKLGWLQTLFHDVMANVNALIGLTSKPSSNRRRNNNSTFQIFNTLEESSIKLQRLAEKYDIPLKPKYFASHVDAIKNNSFDFSVSNDEFTRSKYQKDAIIPWESSLSAIHRIIDSLPDNISHSPVIYHALIRTLCAYEDPIPLLKAISIIHEMTVKKISIMPETLCSVLNGAIISLNDDDLLTILLEVQDLLHHRNIEDKNIIGQILRTEILAYSRLRMGGDALTKLQKLRLSGISADIKLYRWTIHAVYCMFPKADWEWKTILNPTSLCEWLLREMNRDGHILTSELVSLLLRLHTKAVRIVATRDNNKYSKELSEMETFLSKCLEGGYMNHVKVEMSEEIAKEMIKVYCIINQPELALQYLEKVEKQYGIKPSTNLYEPIMFNYAAFNNLTQKAEELLTKLVNQNIPINEHIVDSLLICYIRRGGGSGDSINSNKSANNDNDNNIEFNEASDRIQDIYNQHKVRPSPTGILRLLDHCLQRGDVHEARRVVDLINQMFTTDERETLIGQATLGTYNEMIGKTSERAIRKEKEQKTIYEGVEVVVPEDMRAVDESATMDEISVNKRSKSSRVKPKEISNTSEFAGRKFQGDKIKKGVPFGQRQRGVLSEEQLSERFVQFGLSLN